MPYLPIRSNTSPVEVSLLLSISIPPCDESSIKLAFPVMLNTFTMLIPGFLLALILNRLLPLHSVPRGLFLTLQGVCCPASQFRRGFHAPRLVHCDCCFFFGPCACTVAHRLAFFIPLCFHNSNRVTRIPSWLPPHRGQGAATRRCGFEVVECGTCSAASSTCFSTASKVVSSCPAQLHQSAISRL